VLPPELLAEALRPELRPSLFGRTAWSDRALTEASTDTVLGRALARRLRGRVAEELTPAYEHALRRGGATVLWPYFDARWVERATGVLAEQRPAALAALVPAAVPCVADAQEAQLARWMSGPLEPAWRTAVLAERSPLTEVLDVSKLRSSLFAAWNPARGAPGPGAVDPGRVARAATVGASRGAGAASAAASAAGATTDYSPESLISRWFRDGHTPRFP
jgi:hypothetical protein